MSIPRSPCKDACSAAHPSGARQRLRQGFRLNVRSREVVATEGSESGTIGIVRLVSGPLKGEVAAGVVVSALGV